LKLFRGHCQWKTVEKHAIMSACVCSENTDAASSLPLHKNSLHDALENGRYDEAYELIRLKNENFLMKFYENYEGYSPASHKSCLHIISAIKDKQQAVRHCRQFLSRISEGENKEKLLNATVVEELHIGVVTVRARVAAIHIAAYNGNLRLMRVLCRVYGVDINSSSSETVEDQRLKRITPLCWAATRGHTDVVKLVIQSLNDVNAVCNDNGDTALHIACRLGHTEVVKMLLDHEADVNASLTHNGATPLYVAAHNGHTIVVRMLLDNKADVNVRCTDDGATPLQVAAQNRHKEVVKLLHETAAEPQSRFFIQN